jgi:hypothetical protein
LGTSAESDLKAVDRHIGDKTEFWRQDETKANISFSIIPDIMPDYTSLSMHFVSLLVRLALHTAQQPHLKLSPTTCMVSIVLLKHSRSNSFMEARYQ